MPEDATEEEKKNFENGQGGALQAIMCVDKDVEELTTFENLVAESEEMGKEWQIVLMAGLAGKNGNVPTSEDAEEPLKSMVNMVQNGGDLSSYMALDKEGYPIKFN